jgi:hypothetical protein
VDLPYPSKPNPQWTPYSLSIRLLSLFPRLSLSGTVVPLLVWMSVAIFVMPTVRPSETRGLESETLVPSSQSDFIVEDHGSIILLHPITHLAREWVEVNIGEDNGYQGLWPTVTIEGRYLARIIDGIREDGLAIEAA